MDIRSIAKTWIVVLWGLSGATNALAWEALDGRLQAHGFAEVQMRALNSNYNSEWDLAQWYNVFNLELEADIAPDGWGPFSLVSAFVRLEARYDCVWTRACGLGASADVYGNRANKGPDYLTDAVESDFNGTTFGNPDAGDIFPGQRVETLGKIAPFDTLADSKGVDGCVNGAPASQCKGGVNREDDPFPIVFQQYGDGYKFYGQKVRGPSNNRTFPALPLGPWRPRDTIVPNGTFATIPNFLSADTPGYPDQPGEASAQTFFSALDLPPRNGKAFLYPLPFRPTPTQGTNPQYARGLAHADDPFSAPNPGVGARAKGLYYPSPGLQRLIRNDVSLNNYDQNFGQSELAWNRGASQQQTKELKEAYLDLEMFDGRLWTRVGKQTIVWGKTELFRNQDQFNPQDFALASLPSLEESRIAQWSLRSVYSFYDVGPLEDVRLELGIILEDFEPVDLGRCGEPFSPTPVCFKTFGLYIHGITGAGLAGERRPPTPWDDTSGFEYGGRLEWRWGRFSFALSDYYGYDDFPYPDPIFQYERNVDPTTGRPRFANTRLPCDPDGTGDTSGCLGNTANLNPTPGTPERMAQDEEIINLHPANQTLFHVSCASTVGIADYYPDLEFECGLNIFSSPLPLAAGSSITVVESITKILAGRNYSIIDQTAEIFDALPRNFLVTPLSVSDNPPSTVPTAVDTLDDALSYQQQALLGCGPFFGTTCDQNGIDLLNMEGSILIQSFPGFDGSPLFGQLVFDKDQPGCNGSNYQPDWTDPALCRSGQQNSPGTIPFKDAAGGNLPIATRYDGRGLISLPGSCGPGPDPLDPSDDVCFGRAYDPTVDGIPVIDGSGGPNAAITAIRFSNRSNCDVVPGDPLLHPWTCQPFQSELAAMSWNFVLLLIVASEDDFGDENGDGDPFEVDEFDPARQMEAGRCSFITPQYCKRVHDILLLAGNTRNDVRAGGTSRFGRRDFTWHGTQELVLNYDKANVLGFSMDFAEDVTKSNWGFEFSWVEGLPVGDTTSANGLKKTDEYRLTVSADRPTFINFLNANRSIFINTQWFFSYRDGYTKDFQVNGPWNVLATLTAFTGYYQDRLMMFMTMVYDAKSNSGAGLPSFVYRFTESFSAQFGLAFFWGRYQGKDQYVTPRSVTNNVGKGAYKEYVENGLSAVRHRDEMYLRIRWTF